MSSKETLRRPLAEPVPPPLPPSAAPRLSELSDIGVPPLPPRLGFRFGSRNSRWRRLFTFLVIDQPAWLTSFLVHMLVLLLLAMVLIRVPLRPDPLTLSFTDAEAQQLETTELQFPAAGAAPEDVQVESVDLAQANQMVLPQVTLPTVPTTSVEGIQPAALSAQLIGPEALTVGGFAGRRGRRASAVQFGATAESEAAVDRALVWLAAHQRSNGSWSFALDDCGCRGCRNAGRAGRAINAATALALLPFLGGGHTHEHGTHRGRVERGLLYLINQQDSDGSFHESIGRMYSHGLAALVLCEALGMTTTDPGSEGRRYNQRRLRRAAQRAVDYIVYAQHSAGGWRYQPRQPGDTSVVGWQAMALQSGKMSGLTVPRRTLDGTARFLNSVQSDTYGGHYGYTAPGSRPTTNAVGLLTRMYLGWDRTHVGIAAGVESLDEVGPSVNNVYFNYYATQVMHHFGGPLWESWHPALRDHLVDTQEINGHEAGSWFFEGDSGSTVGGRLYITAMAAMILEVYYRHMPIYSDHAVKLDL